MIQDAHIANVLGLLFDVGHLGLLSLDAPNLPIAQITNVEPQDWNISRGAQQGAENQQLRLT